MLPRRPSNLRGGQRAAFAWPNGRLHCKIPIQLEQTVPHDAVEGLRRPFLTHSAQQVMNMQTIQTFLTTTATELGIKILAAIAFWIIGRWLIGKVVNVMQAGMSRNHVDPTLTKYLGSIVAVMLNIALVIGILGYFGIQTTSFAALIAGAGVAIGAAWSGMLGNFAAGAFMLVLRPFKVGDFVGIGGIVGTVTELGLFATTLLTPDNVVTLVGNGKVFGDVISNYSSTPARRVERTAQLAGGVDALDAIARFRAAVTAIPNVVQNPAPEVNVLDINLVGTVIAVRPYCHTDHYWQVYFDTNEAILRVSREAGWPAPTPAQITRLIQMDKA
ncbi:MAG: mechanosensitive ion channel family protein [Gemmatimonadaceae bacterium]|nr:mechanosensitive ion channel family protein [Gemmatimonadaceae bacterium]